MSLFPSAPRSDDRPRGIRVIAAISPRIGQVRDGEAASLDRYQRHKSSFAVAPVISCGRCRTVKQLRQRTGRQYRKYDTRARLDSSNPKPFSLAFPSSAPARYRGFYGRLITISRKLGRAADSAAVVVSCRHVASRVVISRSSVQSRSQPFEATLQSGIRSPSRARLSDGKIAAAIAAVRFCRRGSLIACSV